MTMPRLVIDHCYTRDGVRPYIERGVEMGWTCSPIPPDGSGEWVIFDFSPDNKTGWRRFRLVSQQ